MRQVHLEGLMTLNNSECHILIIDIMQPVFLTYVPLPPLHKTPKKSLLTLFLYLFIAFKDVTKHFQIATSLFFCILRGKADDALPYSVFL